jgi:Kdo2-lipid IVA lauroyltransferase/acyltransferase
MITQWLIFYLCYPFLYAVSLLPFRFLYLHSDLLYLILYYSGYRKKVVLTNLKNSFPEKSDEEISKLCKAFYHYLCDLILEIVKSLSISENDISKRMLIKDTSLFEKLYKDKQNAIFAMGHYGNWEWAGSSFSIKKLHQLQVIYRPLSNVYFEKMMTRMRTKFGTQIIPVNQTLREMVASRKKLTCTAFIADQTPSHEQVFWTPFLNQDTPVFTGPEKLAIKFNYPVVYISVKRIKRGFYEIESDLLFEKSAETRENEISEAFIKKLEKDIIQDPVIWLWSHRRWKFKRSTGQKAT